MEFKLENIYFNRPFKTRNADEYALEDVLDLFVDPTDGISRPFDYENAIVKGKMGSGKTMYLRANHAYYLYTLVSDLIEGNKIILPIYINLSECQNYIDAKKIYESIIVKILGGMLSVCEDLSSSDKMVEIHKGYQRIGSVMPDEKEIGAVKKKLSLMSAEEYVETVQKESSIEGKLMNSFLNICRKEGNKKQLEIRKKVEPQFEDIRTIYEQVLRPFSGKILILFDEVSSLNRSFFKGRDEDKSYFEVLMNQLRTLSFIRTKVAIYPYSICDILMETRYGDNVLLEGDIFNGYEQYKNRIITLIDQYLKKIDEEMSIEDVFEVPSNGMGLIEQLLFASGGNMRRLVHLLDLTMSSAYRRTMGKDKVKIEDVISAIKTQAKDCESLFTSSEQEWLSSIVKVCKNRGTYRFSFPKKTVNLVKYTNKSSEYNLINVIENGAGRKGSVYEFDYSYCVYKDIPTHYIKGTERLDKTRSYETGDFIKKVTRITDTLIQQAVIPGKIEGEISYVNQEKDYFFIKDMEGLEYGCSKNNIIEDDRKKRISIKKKVRFIPYELGENIVAEEVEIL